MGLKGKNKVNNSMRTNWTWTPGDSSFEEFVRPESGRVYRSDIYDDDYQDINQPENKEAYFNLSTNLANKGIIDKDIQASLAGEIADNIAMSHAVKRGDIETQIPPVDEDELRYVQLDD